MHQITRLRSVVLALAVAICAGRTADAQSRATTRDAIVVSPAWLLQHLKDPNLVLLQIADASGDYATNHIPGARLVDVARVSVSTPGGLSVEMPSPDSLRAYLAELGVSDNSRIVVYYGRPGVTSATRLMVTLDYAGFGSVSSMLDGGQPAWVAAGNALTADVPAPHPGTLAALRTQPVIASADFVKAHIGTPGFAIVDGRAAAYYDGTSVGGSPTAPHRAGHIAGAGSVPYTSTYGTTGVWKTVAELEEIFSKAGVKPGDTVIGYCHIGIQATAVIFAARTLGHPVMLYDGSFQDWSTHADFPVEKPPAKGGQ